MTDHNATDPFDALTATLGALGTPWDALRFEVRDALTLLQTPGEVDLDALENREPDDGHLVTDVFGVLVEDLAGFHTLPALEALRFAVIVAFVVETGRFGTEYLAECEEEAHVFDVLEDLEREFGDTAV